MTVSIILPSASESCARAVRAKSNNRSDNIRFMEKEVSLHRSQILRDLRAMQAVAAEFPGCAENSTAFWREEFKTLTQRSRKQTALEIAEMYHYLSSL